MASFTIKQVEKILSDNGMAVESISKCAEELCRRHSIVIDEIKEERDGLKEKAEKADTLQKELDDIKKEDYKTKYETEKKAHDELKATTAAEKEHTTKIKAFKEMLKAEGFTEKGIEKILKYDIEKVKLNKEGKIDNADDLKKHCSDEWGDYKGKETTTGTSVANPPAGTNTPERKPSRAAELAAKYHSNLYGDSKETKGE